MAVSKRLRYEILRRDNHTCRYCGAKAPDVTMVVDHVTPTALGGSDEPANLVAACVDCNNGKSATPPGASLVDDVAADALRWSRAMQLVAASHEEEFEQRRALQDEFDDAWRGWTYGGTHGRRLEVPRDDNWRESVDNWLRLGMTMPLLEECIAIAMQRKNVSPDKTWRYFCGVTWSRLSELQKAARDLIGVAEEIERERGLR